MVLFKLLGLQIISTALLSQQTFQFLYVILQSLMLQFPVKVLFSSVALPRRKKPAFWA
jgi:hypothetical protein